MFKKFFIYLTFLYLHMTYKRLGKCLWKETELIHFDLSLFNALIGCSIATLNVLL